MFVLPGFIVYELATSRRATTTSRGDLDTILRSLWYSVIVHLLLAATGWTLSVVQKVDGRGEWEQHVGGVALFVAVAVLVLPTVLGGLLGARLRRAEQAGNLTTVDYALGGRDSRSAWDYLFGHLQSGFVVIYVEDLETMVGSDVDGELGRWRSIVGRDL